MAHQTYLISVINAAVNEGFEYDPEDSVIEVAQQAEDELRESEPYGVEYEHCPLEGHGMSQCYTWQDDQTGMEKTMTGEIFTFPKAKADEGVYFHKRPDMILDFQPVNYFDIPDKGDPSRKEYVFVYAHEVKGNGMVAYLYDTMA